MNDKTYILMSSSHFSTSITVLRKSIYPVTYNTHPTGRTSLPSKKQNQTNISSSSSTKNGSFIVIFMRLKNIYITKVCFIYQNIVSAISGYV